MASGPLGQRYRRREEDRRGEVQGGIRGVFGAERPGQAGEVRPVRLRRRGRGCRPGLEPGLRQPERHPEQPLRRCVRGRLRRRVRRLQRIRGLRRRPYGPARLPRPGHPHARQADPPGDRYRMREGDQPRAQASLPRLRRARHQEQFRHQDLSHLQGHGAGPAYDQHPLRAGHVLHDLPSCASGRT